MGVMGPQVEMFKAALLFSPHHITQLCSVENDVDVLTSIAFLNDAAMIANMKNELPRYLARASPPSSVQNNIIIQKPYPHSLLRLKETAN